MTDVHLDYNDIQILGQEIRTAILDATPSLRDQFAKAALTGLIASYGPGDREHGAEIAYEFADAMLKQRAAALQTKDQSDAE